MYSVFILSQPSWAAWIEIQKKWRKKLLKLGRSPHGLRGLKYDIAYRETMNNCRSPHGLRGLKFILQLEIK